MLPDPRKRQHRPSDSSNGRLVPLGDHVAPGPGETSAAAQSADGAASAGPGARSGELARNRITASASIVAVAGPDGVTRLPVLASQVPLVLRRTPDAVYVIGGAAGPIGGDELSLRISVAERGVPAGADRGGVDRAARARTGSSRCCGFLCLVGAGAHLEYLPEPVVVTTGARHATVVSVSLDEGASLLLRDELLLGRHGEDGGTAGRCCGSITPGGRCCGSRLRSRAPTQPAEGRRCYPATGRSGRCCG